ncbi:hypothetical protein [Capnocytophaga catalasegens]|uniref:Lipoprotein n=1 Tax=Capnocytophaga catalasegens TaxID=1004260 RepID=A0AAV5AZM0_9FLAO|nr:hypothetical protein [Capnocytophaga catalasegens]GIZ14160.1 hypothetical protein RCZ03_01610 [Capnocytophaga catalasegens]GJM51485.1 hypothetical protein RCZ15_24580 [Capnocytophaga catalasegens]GJM53993.1 hypothetical protein RCZ16_23090 [Capnocytophaga catalasegens]
MNLKLNVFTISILAMVTSCQKSEMTPDKMPKLQMKEKVVQVKKDDKLGKILTDASGRTLYVFTLDADGKNHCSGDCEKIWPIFFADNITSKTIGMGLDVKDFGSIQLTSGKKQTTYKGHPLYYFAPDGMKIEKPGETKGEGARDVWFVAKPDYTILLSNTQLIGADGKGYIIDKDRKYKEDKGITQYFTDAYGLTLYTFVQDKKNMNSFTKSDFSNNAIWPIYEQKDIIVPSTLDKSLFGTIDVYGKKQLTYKGWPLYYFGQDGKKQGATKGISVPQVGVWPVVIKDINQAPEK